MKTLTLSILRCLRPWCFVLVCLLPSTGAMAQQEAQAGDAPIVLTRQNRTRVIKPGRRIKLYGPTGTSPIKGKLVSMGDSIIIRPDNNRDRAQTRVVAVEDLQAIGLRRLGWQVLGIYYATRALLAVTVGGILSISVPIFVGSSVLILLALAGYYALLIGVCFLLAAPRFRLPQWRLSQRGDRQELK